MRSSAKVAAKDTLDSPPTDVDQVYAYQSGTG